ncbi:MAG: hypothetical protein LBL83_04020, partial [Clostridiales bacterium]|nr:hypothetical protein [Clostridiales bacterium]
MKGRAADLPFHRKSRIFVTGAYALIMAGVLYYALFGSAASLSGGSPLYTDLSSCAAYARNGFDPDEIAAIPALKSEPDLEPAPGGWQIFRLAGDPAGMRRIMNSGLPGLPRRAFMSPFGAKAQEFTILFEVEIGADKIAYLDADPSRVPGISLAGIGENWQIFLNGRLVRSEMHLDQDGRILVGKSMRDVIFPVDRALLAEGTNILAFRIVGDPTYDSTGFIYSRPYYIDEYQDIEKHHDASLLYALCGIYFFIGVYHLMLFLGQKRDFANLYHSIFTIMLGAYTIIRTSLIYSLIQDTGVATRIELAVLFASIPAVGAFVESLAQLRPTLVSKLYYGFCLLMVASVSALPLPFSDDALYVWNLVSLAYILRVVISVAARSLLRETRRGWDERRAAGLAEPLWRANVRAFLTTPLGNNAIALGFMVFCAIFDVIDVIFIANSYGLFRYGFFVFVSISAYGLAERFDRLLMQLDASNTALDEANTMLEATVVDRTRELELKAAELERQARELEVQALAAQEASEAAQLASKAKSEFLAHMSHEIRTPMNAILGMLELIQRKELAPDVREDTMIIKNAGRSLLSIINDILDFSKIESGRLEIVPARYSLASLLNDVVSIIRVRLVDKPLFFIVDLDSRLPASLVGDEARLRQILINLLSNALKYTREGHFSLRVGGGARDDGARSGGAGGSSAGGSGAGSGDGESGGAWGSGAGRGDVDGSSAWGSGPKSSGAGGDGVDSNNADGGARSSDAGGSGADDSDTGSCGGESGGAWGNGAFELRLEVSDTGVGIRDEDIGRLFQDFTQLDLAKHKSVEGTGLG